MKIRFSYPYRLVLLANARLHHRAKAAVVKEARGVAKLHTLSKVQPADRDGKRFSRIEVTMTRVSPGRADDDGVVSACKPVRDAIADVFGIDDGRRDFWRWSYADRRGPFAVEIEISAVRKEE